MKQNAPRNVDEDVLQMLRGGSPAERLLHRLHAVTLVVRGLSSSEVARAFGDSPRAVAYWVTRFKKHGVQGLHEETRSGRPPKLDPAQMKRVQRFLEQSADDSRLAQARAVTVFIRQQFQISLSVQQCQRMVMRLKP